MIASFHPLKRHFTAWRLHNASVVSGRDRSAENGAKSLELAFQVRRFPRRTLQYALLPVLRQAHQLDAERFSAIWLPMSGPCSKKRRISKRCEPYLDCTSRSFDNFLEPETDFKFIQRRQRGQGPSWWYVLTTFFLLLTRFSELRRLAAVQNLRHSEEITQGLVPQSFLGYHNLPMRGKLPISCSHAYQFCLLWLVSSLLKERR